MEPKILDKVRSKCWQGKHPIVRVVMNLVDHPHEMVKVEHQFLEKDS